MTCCQSTSVDTATGRVILHNFPAQATTSRFACAFYSLRREIAAKRVTSRRKILREHRAARTRAFGGRTWQQVARTLRLGRRVGKLRAVSEVERRFVTTDRPRAADRKKPFTPLSPVTSSGGHATGRDWPNWPKPPKLVPKLVCAPSLYPKLVCQACIDNACQA